MRLRRTHIPTFSLQTFIFHPSSLFSLSKKGFDKHIDYYGKYESCHPVIRSLLWCMG